MIAKPSFFILFFLTLFTCLFSAAPGLLPARAFSSHGEWGLLSSQGVGAPLVVEHRLQGTQTSAAVVLGSRAQARELGHTGSSVPWHVGSFQIKDQTHVSCIGRQVLYH